MKTDLVKTVYILLGLVVAAALQDMLPTFGGVKPPFLQVFALYVALAWETEDDSGSSRRKHSQAWIWTSIAAGYMIEALSGLPFGCCIGFLLPACAVARFVRRAVTDLPPVVLGLVSAMVAAPFHEAWLDAWGVTGGESAFVRFFASALPAAAAGVGLFVVLPRIERFAGLSGEEPA